MTTGTQDTSALMRAYLAIEDLESRLDEEQRARTEPIAIVGMGCRLPGGPDPEAFWRSLRDGVDATSEAPRERWDTDALFDPDPAAAGKVYTRRGAFVDGVDRFDPFFFGISPREAAAIDPQHRLLLEVAWEALEGAGVAADRLAATKTGVFLGLMTADYTRLQIGAGDAARADAYTGIGGDASFASGRLSYVLGLQGPSMTVATACSSSLVAIHLACESLRRRECDLALAGGANLMLSADTTVLLCRMRALAPDGRSKTFDASADGYGRGEGAGVVVLKRLSDALASGDDIVAVVRGSAVNHDGQSGGLTVPNGLAQEALIREALAAACVAPEEVQYVEAHGTGTPLGDPIEIRALASALCGGREKANPLLVGSVKTNIGHLEAASGIAAVLKVALALRNGEIPPHLHLRDPNPHIPWGEIPLAVPAVRTPWPRGERPRIAGISSFGLSGTNAHLVLEEAPAAPAREAAARSHHALLLSASTESALRALAGAHAERVRDLDEASLADACFTAGAGRARKAHRLGVVGGSGAEIAAELASFAQGASCAAAVGTAPVRGRPKVVFLLSGQGSQHAGMGRALFASQPVFRRALERCDELLRPHMERSILSVMFAEDGALLDETAYTQPALFAIEYALAELWRSWGVTPDVVMGHSVGELAAACVAGVMELPDAAALIAARGRLMQSLPKGGAMAAVLAERGVAEEAIKKYSGRLAVAAVNGPTETVISGDADAIDEVLAALAARGVKTRRLQVSHAFHSPRMEPILSRLEEAAAGVAFAAPRIALVSNLTGAPLGAGERFDAAYLRRHAREAVQFHAGMTWLFERGHDLFLEIGPHPTLAGAASRFFPGEKGSFLPSLRKGHDDWRQLLSSVAELHARGVDIDARGIDEGRRARPIALPTSPFERVRCWAPDRRRAGRPPAAGPFDRAVRSPLVRERIFEADLDLDGASVIADHRIGGRPIAPGALHLALALLAGRDTLATGPIELRDIEFPAPLDLGDRPGATVQVVLDPASGGDATFRVLTSAAGAPDGYAIHAAGSLSAAGAPDAGIDMAEAAARCGEERPADVLYDHLAEQSFTLGPSLRWLARVRLRDGEAVGRMERPGGTGGDARWAWTGVIDAAFQLAACAALPRLTGSPMLPVGVRRITVLRDPGEGALTAHATVRPSGARGDGLEGDIHVLDERGEPVLVVHGLRTVRAASLPGGAKASGRELHHVEWQIRARGPRSRQGSGAWLVLSDRGGVGEHLAGLLQDRGEDATLVRAGTDEIARALDAAAGGRLPGRVVHLRSLDATSLETGCALGFESALGLVQALAARRWAGQLVLVTSGGETAGARSGPSAPEQAPLWGLGRVIAREHPEMGVVRVDVDASDPASAARALADEILSGDREEDIVLRGEERRVARLVRVSPRAGAGEEVAPRRLVIPRRGVLSDLVFEPMERRPPGRGEVEIRVGAAALNFRDVLNVLDLYPGDPGPLGLECSGTVAAVGEGVSGLAPGDAVMVLAPACFASYVTAPAALVVKKPARLSIEEAATIPVAFLTAYHAFHGIAKIKPGDRVLVHAAAGGVGVAAIQLALRAGAEVFATASPAKWDFVRSLGVEHVMSSRTTEFADDVMRITGGSGVDVVLNSLIGDAIPKSLSVLRQGGCFVEIGKREIWDDERLRAARPDVSYVPFDLVELTAKDPAAVRAMFDAIAERLSDGSLRPLPGRVIPMEDAVSAFRLMSQARHTGKIVLSAGGAGARAGIDLAAAVRRDASYLVTGGLGALGLLFARRLADLGAGHVVLAGRSAPGPAAQDAIRAMEAQGTQVTVVRGDVAVRADVDRMIAAAPPERPLRGVIHSAGLLDDGVIVSQTMERARRVMAPKVWGARHLHDAAASSPLDFFVLFSSVAAVLGAAGQASYAAGNAYLGALARELRGRGVPALAIDWGPFAEAGMAAALGEQGERRWAEIGVRLLPLARGIELFEEALASGLAQVFALDVSWSRYARAVPGALLDELAPPAAGAAEPGAGRAAQGLDLAGKTPADRRAALIAFVKGEAARVLGFGASRPLDLTRPLNELGLDSLMAVELRNALGAGARLALPATLLFDHPSVEQLAAHLDSLLAPPAPAADQAEEAREEARGELVEEIRGLSDSEVTAMLEEELLRSAGSLARL